MQIKKVILTISHGIRLEASAFNPTTRMTDQDVLLNHNSLLLPSRGVWQESPNARLRDSLDQHTGSALERLPVGVEAVVRQFSASNIDFELTLTTTPPPVIR